MAAVNAKKVPVDLSSIEDRLMDGHYDQLLDAFQKQIEAAADTLRRCHAAMRAENTLRS